MPFANPLTGGESANTVYVARTGRLIDYRCAAHAWCRPDGEREAGAGRTRRGRSREVDMRALLWVVGVVAGVLILLGLLLEAVRWLIIIGVIALVIVIVWGVVKGRQAMSHQSRRR